MADRLPCRGKTIKDGLLKIWEWEAALVHTQVVSIYLGFGPHRCTDWEITPAYQGKFYLDTDDTDMYLIREDRGWRSIEIDPVDILAGLARIKVNTVQSGANEDANTI